MPEVHVIFPPKGGVLLTHERMPVMQKDTIFWHVHSGNKKVKSVRIKFEKSKSRFFPEIKGKNTAVEVSSWSEVGEVIDAAVK